RQRRTGQLPFLGALWLSLLVNDEARIVGKPALLGAFAEAFEQPALAAERRGEAVIGAEHEHGRNQPDHDLRPVGHDPQQAGRLAVWPCSPRPPYSYHEDVRSRDAK